MPAKRGPTPREPSRPDGFTIIEVLIVLAIAGLIMLIVFQALPALQRSSRNNQRRQDVSSILEAVSHYELNNSGNIPTCNNYASCTGANDPLQNTKLTYYTSSTASSIVISTPDAGNGTGFTPRPKNAGSLDSVQVFNAAKCDGANPGEATDQGAGYNDVVALFSIETGSSTQKECQQL